MPLGLDDVALKIFECRKAKKMATEATYGDLLHRDYHLVLLDKGSDEVEAQRLHGASIGHRHKNVLLLQLQVCTIGDAG